MELRRQEATFGGSTFAMGIESGTSLTEGIRPLSRLDRGTSLSPATSTSTCSGPGRRQRNSERRRAAAAGATVPPGSLAARAWLAAGGLASVVEQADAERVRQRRSERQHRIELHRRARQAGDPL